MDLMIEVENLIKLIAKALYLDYAPRSKQQEIGFAFQYPAESLENYIYCIDGFTFNTEIGAAINIHPTLYLKRVLDIKEDYPSLLRVLINLYGYIYKANGLRGIHKVLLQFKIDVVSNYPIQKLCLIDSIGEQMETLKHILNQKGLEGEIMDELIELTKSELLSTE
jgi:hypothetical protein